jgi:hypothetical protein
MRASYHAGVTVVAGIYEGTGEWFDSGEAFGEVFGSSTKNAEGNYIAWKESLRRKR